MTTTKEVIRVAYIHNVSLSALLVQVAEFVDEEKWIITNVVIEQKDDSQFDSFWLASVYYKIPGEWSGQ